MAFSTRAIVILCCFFSLSGSQYIGDEEYDRFLKHEVDTIKALEKTKVLPQFEGYVVSSDGYRVTLEKKSQNEEMLIYFEGNLGMGDNFELNPNFTIGIHRSRPEGTFEFMCSFTEKDAKPNGSSVSFRIDEVKYQGASRWDRVDLYSSATDRLNTNLRDRLMSFLNEKGITIAFVEKFYEFTSSLKPRSYVERTEKLSQLFNLNCE